VTTNFRTARLKIREVKGVNEETTSIMAHRLRPGEGQVQEVEERGIYKYEGVVT
jgi:hypothetical protein